MSEKMKVDDGHVVSMHYTLHVDGKVVDSSRGAKPLQFIQGMGHIIPGLEHELYELQVGESKRVSVAPEDGYGLADATAFTAWGRPPDGWTRPVTGSGSVQTGGRGFTV